MNYKFRMQRILDFREDIEKHKKEIYGSLVKRLHEAEDILRAIEAEKVDALMKSNEEKEQGDVSNLKNYNNYVKMLLDRIEKQENVIEKIKIEVELAKQDMLDAVKDRKAFDKLKENDYEEFLYNEKKNEEKLIDGIVTFNTSTKEN